MLQAQVDAQRNELDLLEDKVTTRVREKLMYQFMMKRTASWEPQKEIDLYLECLGGMKDLMDLDELTTTTDSLPSIDLPEGGRVASCAAFTTSNVPPECDAEKELVSEALSSAASAEKETSETLDV